MVKQYERYEGSTVYPTDKGAIGSLATSMRESGFLKSHPILLFDGKILDGWHRYQAALLAEVEPVFTEFDGDIKAAALLIIHENGDRRHLSGQQKVAAELVCLQRAGVKRDTEDIAQRTGLSVGTVRSLERKPNETLEKLATARSRDLRRSARSRGLL